MIEIKDDVMVLCSHGQVRATAKPDGGTWQVDGYPGRRFTRNQAITALTLTERLEVFGDDDPHVRSWREELGLDG